MKTIAILPLLLISFLSIGQCLTVSNFYWHNNNTYDIDITNDNPSAQWVVCPDGSSISISGLATVTCSGTLPSNIGSLQFVGLLPPCSINFTPDQSVFITNQNAISSNSDCSNNCNGSICLSDNSGTPLNFSSSAGNSTSGCLTGVCTGAYSITPDPVLSGGVYYYFDDLQVVVSDFEAEVEISGMTASINVISGSGNYSFEIFDSSGTLISTQSEDTYIGNGCYEFTVTDTQTNCTFSETIYLVNGCPEDFNNDGVINTYDFLLFLPSLYNPQYNPATDFDCDGFVGAGELLQFLGALGTTCI
jgi:hypothetical protein